MSNFLGDSLGLIVTLIIGGFIVMMVIMLFGKFDHWTSRFTEKDKRPLFRDKNTEHKDA